MLRFIIASHYTMATGLKETVEFLTGVEESIYDISAYTTESYVLEEEIAKIFAQFENTDTVVIMTDLFAGSVNQKFHPYLNDHTHLITGVNAPLVLELILAREENITSSYILKKIEEAKKQIIYVNEWEAPAEEDDE